MHGCNNFYVSPSCPVAPRFTTDASFKDTITLKAGSSTSVPVPFSAHPAPKGASLAHNGAPVRDPKRALCRLDADKLTFDLKKVEKLDAGQYEMSVENEFGRGAVTIKVIVLGALTREAALLFMRC